MEELYVPNIPVRDKVWAENLNLCHELYIIGPCWKYFQYVNTFASPEPLDSTYNPRMNPWLFMISDLNNL